MALPVGAVAEAEMIDTKFRPTPQDIRDALFASRDYDTRKMSAHNWRTLRVAAKLWLEEMTAPDPLGEALNAGDGSYKP